MFRPRYARPTPLDVVRRNESTMRVMLSRRRTTSGNDESDDNNNNNNAIEDDDDDNDDGNTIRNHRERILHDTARMETSFQHVLETLQQSAEQVHKLVFEWTREAYLAPERRDQLVRAAATVRELRELVFVTSSNNNKLEQESTHDHRNTVPMAALTYVLQTLPHLERVKLGQKVCLDGTREELTLFATTIANHASLKHCVLHGLVGSENEYRRTLILDGIAKNKTLETVWVAEYSSTPETGRPATSETARLLRIPSLVSLEISRAHMHFVSKGIFHAKQLKHLTLRYPMEGTGADIFSQSLRDNETLETLELHLTGPNYAQKCQDFVEDIVMQARHLDKIRLVLRSENKPPLNEIHLHRLTERLVQNGRIQVDCVQLHSKQGDPLKLDALIRSAESNLRVQSAINKAGRRQLQAQPGDRKHWMNAMTSLAHESGLLHRTRCYFCFFKMNPDMLSKMSRAHQSQR